MIRTIALILALACSPAAAQVQAPRTYDLTVGTSSAQILQSNPSRTRIIFINPNDTAKIAVCPQISGRTAGAMTCTVNGPGSITLLPYAAYGIEAAGSGTIPSAWNAIASAGGSSLTVQEWP